MKAEEKVFLALADKTRVEFALMDDIKGNFKTAKTKLENSKNFAFGVNQEIFDYSKSVKDVEDYLILVLQDIAQLKKQIAAIGVDAPAEILAIEKESNSLIQNSKSIRSKLASLKIATW